MQQALEIIIGGLLQGGAFALVALGFALIYRVTGTINLAQGAFVVVGALLLYTFHQVLLWPLPLAFLASLGVTVLIGTLLAQFILEPALRKLPPGGMVILTAGMLTLFEGAILLCWGSQPYQLEPFSGSRPYEVAGLRFPTQSPWDAGATVLIVFALWYVLQRTTLGKALRACSENPAAAALMGINVRLMTVISYAVAAGIGGIAGMVIGPIVSLQFDGGGIFTTSGFIAVTIGGIASFFGSLVGGLGLGLIEQGAAGYISSLFSTTIALVLLLAMLILRPTGIIAGRIRRREDVREIAHNQSDVSTKLNRKQGMTLGIIVLLLIVFAPILLNAFGGGGLLSSLVIAGIFFIALLGLDVLMGYCGQVSLGHAAFMATGGYSAAICCVKFGLPPLVGVVAGLVVSLACATVLSLVTVKLRGHYMALATLSFGLLIDTLTVGLSDWTGGPSGMTGIPNFSIPGFTFAGPVANYYLVWGVVLVSLLLLANAMRSDFGRTLRAIRTDQTAALALGIDVPRYKLYAFLIGAAFASIAGSLLAFDFQFLSPDMVSTQQSFLIVTMLIIGGEGTLVGPVIGVILLTLLPTAFQFLANYKTLASGILLVLAMTQLPSGLYGGFTSLVRRATGGPSNTPEPVPAEV
jgi:ABC-type branched-subunit amino acid transport system permease subunit